MPREKDLKRLVRARMKKTGEAYTAARAQILRKPKTNPPRQAGVSASLSKALAAPDAEHFAAIAGMSDAKLKESTGCTWQRWVRALDRYGAETMSHRDIASLVREKYKTSSWWSQTVAVGYERIKGLRARGQQRNGTYQISKSRTYNVPVEALFDAWTDARLRQRWLKEADVKVRKATAPKSIRLGWPDGGIVAVGFFPKGESKSYVAIEHTKLPDRATGERIKREWSDRFDALGDVLAPG
ncbi:MAG TPA: hypothetical protein VF785_15595 [Gemmatimonadaceae bacterium]